VQLYSADSLLFLPDGTRRHDRRALIVPGEKKVQVLHRTGFAWEYALLSATSGCGAWLGNWGEKWIANELDAWYTTTMFDPKEEHEAQLTCRLFGRYGSWVNRELKPDDWLLAEGESGIPDRANYLREVLKRDSVRG
jgi:hypothetical protein